MASKNRVKENKKEDILFFKMTGMFFIACFLIAFFLRLANAQGRGEDNAALNFYNLCKNPVYLAVLGVLFVLAVVFFIYRKVSRKDEKNKYLASINLVALTGYALFCSVAYTHISQPIIPLLIGTAVLIVLYYIFYIFKRDFFIFSVIAAVFAGILWIFAGKIDLGSVIAKVAFAVLGLAACLFFDLYHRKSAVRKQTTEANHGKAARKHASLTFWPCYVLFAVFAVLLFGTPYLPLGTLSIMITMLVIFIAAGLFYTIRLIQED